MKKILKFEDFIFESEMREHELILEAFNSSIWAKIGYLFAAIAIKRSTKKVDPKMHNGAMLVGLNGVVVKSHGSTDSIGFANAIKVSISLVENKINEKITAQINLVASSIQFYVYFK